MAQFVTVEEHFLSDNLPGGLITLPRPPAVPAGTEERLRDTGKIRLQSMDENNIKFSVLSHLVANAKPSNCPSINDDLYKRVSQYPSRFAAFAILSMHDPASAAVELERCVRELGFFPPSFHPVFETAQNLEVPVYFHPTFPNPEMEKVLYDGPYPPDVGMALSGWCAGFHYESGIHILRLFAAGLFDQFPRLKILIGHAGELLPYTLERNWHYSSRWSVASSRRRDLRQVWDNNIWVSTSATFELSPIACLLRVTKPERILYAVDYPMCSNKEGKKFLEALRESGLVSNAEWEGIAWKNAQDLLRLNV
ncbi:hypothetical protein NM208_g2780 [Fusarium decemcellulare]|uniref:Uncharacterized protein n=1 Tax=Fusarium decemcellulare TaxID=57161 RepID=A0ACC1SR99_9HYPO|nr:hypothetical protein NM208_g2780 [Fusarium decemcellulare]